MRPNPPKCHIHKKSLENTNSNNPTSNILTFLPQGWQPFQCLALQAWHLSAGGGHGRLGLGVSRLWGLNTTAT